MGKIEKETFICVDCETTGLDPKKDRVIEVAAVTFTFTEQFELFDSLVDPKIEIPEETIKIHHITQDMVQGQPTIAEVLPAVLELIGKKTIIGHGIKFDIDILAYEAERAGIPCTIQNNPTIDTLRMARLYGESPTNSLQQLRSHFNIAEEGAHRAMSDVIVNMEVFKNLCRDYKTVEELMKVLSKPIAMRTMPLGKHKGRSLRDIPQEYLQWMANKDFDDDLLYTVRSELKRRRQGQSFSQAANPFADL